EGTRALEGRDGRVARHAHRFRVAELGVRGGEGRKVLHGGPMAGADLSPCPISREGTRRVDPQLLSARAVRVAGIERPCPPPRPRRLRLLGSSETPRRQRSL